MKNFLLNVWRFDDFVEKYSERIGYQLSRWHNEDEAWQMEVVRWTFGVSSTIWAIIVVLKQIVEIGLLLSILLWTAGIIAILAICVALFLVWLITQ